MFPTDIDIGVCIPYCTSMHPHGVALSSSLTKTKAYLVPLQPRSPYFAFSRGVRPDGRVGSGVLGRNRSGFVGLSRDGISASRDRFRGQGGKSEEEYSRKEWGHQRGITCTMPCISSRHTRNTWTSTISITPCTHHGAHKYPLPMKPHPCYVRHGSRRQLPEKYPITDASDARIDAAAL